MASVPIKQLMLMFCASTIETSTPCSTICRLVMGNCGRGCAVSGAGMSVGSWFAMWLILFCFSAKHIERGSTNRFWRQCRQLCQCDSAKGQIVARLHTEHAHEQALLLHVGKGRIWQCGNVLNQCPCHIQVAMVARDSFALF